jgi:hypothetical protein
VIVFTHEEVKLLVVLAALHHPDEATSHELKSLYHKASAVVQFSTDSSGTRRADIASFQLLPKHG